MGRSWLTPYFLLAILMLGSGVGIGLGLAQAPSGSNRSATAVPSLSKHRTEVPSTTLSTTTVNTAPGPLVVLSGDGLGNVRFGQSESSAIRTLDQVLGGPGHGPLDMARNCDVDSAEQWATLTAYFDAGQFVGYSTLAANGERLSHGNLATAMGLQVGDSLTRAQRLYGSAFTTSFAQGGSWSASTPVGTIDGYLTSPPNVAEPTSTIASIEAGSVGCPAVTP